MKTSKSRQFLDGNYFVAMGSGLMIKKFFLYQASGKNGSRPWHSRE
jgi:hypothetical protein